MVDRPILFSAPMVRALLEGRKTQTRHALKLQPIPFAIDDAGTLCDVSLWHIEREPWPRIWMGRDKAGVLTTQEVRFAVGQRLWVKEAWQTGSGFNGPQIAYRSTSDCYDIEAWDGEDEGAGPSFNYARCPSAKWHTWLPDLLSGAEGVWRPSIHMPRWASRLTLIITDVRVQRLQAISEDDAKAEGVRLMRDGGGVFVGREGPAKFVTPWPTAREAFLDIWNTIHGPNADRDNPWVAAISFSVQRANIDATASDALDIAGAA